MTYTDGQLTDIVNNKSLTATTRIKALRKLMGAADEEGRVDFWEDKIATENVRRKITSLPDPFIWQGDFETADLYTSTFPKDVYVSGTLTVNHVEGAKVLHNITARCIELVEDDRIRDENDIHREIDGRINADTLLITIPSTRVLRNLLSKCTLDIKDKVAARYWNLKYTAAEWEELKAFLYQKGVPGKKVYELR